MFEVTKGIVLHHINYSETSVIVKVYTENFGLKSYLIKNLKGAKSKSKKNFIQPLSIIEVVSYPNQKGEINLLKEISLGYPTKSIYFDIKKTAVVFFMDELLYKSIREYEPNQQLYDFIHHSIIHLDNISENISIFNLYFAIHLTKYLGFFPELNYSDKNPIFDLTEGIYKSAIPDHSLNIEPELAYLFYQLSSSNIDNYKDISINYKNRNLLLNKICGYYSIHISGFKNIKTIDIFEKIFSD